MNREQARGLVRKTFTQSFDKGRFGEFIQNLLSHVDGDKAFGCNSRYVKDAFKSHVHRYERLGTYTAPDNRKADILVVELTHGSKLTRARTALRNFVADYLNGRGKKDAALVGFVSPSEVAWRFSYVKMEYATVEKPSGDIGTETRLTPARRFSYIVGPGESCHTAQTRFVDLLQNTQTDPQLTEIEEAFSVEAVTKEFFERYKEFFLAVKVELDKIAAGDKTVGAEFAARKVSTIDFAKKLMGQLVFLYFLQKKGWLGVAKDAPWGTGPHNFLRKLASGDYGQRKNFFNDALEPLFYDSLATDRGHEAFCEQFNCRIPFLNGGLFEPLNNYDWRKTEILLPNRLFTNTDTDPAEEGITGTGILDVFDRYNFTVNEAEPLEKEVAIDPEMLGKVFEGLLGVRERKSKGSFYTPREIVHYMCQESLINYLDTAINGGTDIPVRNPPNHQGAPGIPVGTPAQGETGIPACVSTNQGGTDIPGSVSSAEIHKTNRNLPHWTREGSVYWITFRLADSMPQEKLNAWRAEREIWLEQHPQPWSDEDWKQYDESLGERLQSWLDAGYGSCALRRPDVRQIVQDCLLRFDGRRLWLHAAVIMPNHVHLLLEPVAGNELSELLKGIKGASARKANQILGNTGAAFWMDESYDHIVRSERQRQHFIRYIMENPVKAKLPAGQYWLHQGDTGIPACKSQTQTGMSVLPQTQTGMSVPRCDIETFIHEGDRIADYDAVKANHGIKLPAAVKTNARLLDEKLAAITVCDPAIGSGAFPVGMMQEIVRARSALTPYFNDTHERTPYHFKRHAIQNCLYGVDIDPGAVEIAKLRLWLSLVVDEEDVKQIKPLPNLDYKVVVGNSLLGVEKTLFNEKLLSQLEELKPKYFDETDSGKKHGYRQEIDQIIHQLTNGNTTFDFEIYFSEVFRPKGGFDVVIANPPYVSHDRIREEKTALRNAFKVYDSFADVYCYFVERGIDILAQNGVLAFITSNSYIKADYGLKLRQHLSGRTRIVQILNIEQSRVFETAIVNVAVLIATRTRPRQSDLTRATNSAWNLGPFDRFVRTKGFDLPASSFGSAMWTLARGEVLAVRRTIETTGKTLKSLGAKIRLGIATGYNDAFLIDAAKRRSLVEMDAASAEIIVPIIRGRDIERYGNIRPQLHLIAARNGVNIKRDYPAIFQHFDSFGHGFRSRGAKGRQWWNLRACSFYEDFEHERIVWIELSDSARFTICPGGVWCLNSAYFMLPPRAFSPRYVLGLLNSRLIDFYFRLIAQTSGMGVTRWINLYVEEFPLPGVSPERQKAVEGLVDGVLAAKAADAEADTSALEREIDQLVYQLYGLTPEEIAIVEGAVK